MRLFRDHGYKLATEKKVKVMSHSGALIWSLSTFFVTDILGFSQVDQRLGKSFKVHLGIAKKVEDSQKEKKVLISCLLGIFK